MVYIEIKTISGREYKYLRKTVRDGEKIRHITLKYLGPVSPVYKAEKNRRISNASIYVRQITDEERKALQKAVKSSNAFVRDRARIVLFSAQGLPSPVIAGKLSCDPRKVRTAIGVFNQEDFEKPPRFYILVPNTVQNILMPAQQSYYHDILIRIYVT